MEKQPREGRREKGKGPDNEVRVTNTTYIRTYLAYIARLFQDKHDKIIIKAMGYAIPRGVALAMLVRRRFKGLHQIAEVSAVDLADQDRTRKVGLITITLSKTALDKNHIGYSAPLPDSEVTEYQPFVPGKPAPGAAAEGATEGQQPAREEGAPMRGGRFRPPMGRGRGRGFGGRRGGFRGRRGAYEGYGAREEYNAPERSYGYEEEGEGEGSYGYAPRRSGFRGGRGGFRGQFGGSRGFGGRRGGFRARGGFRGVAPAYQAQAE